MPPEQSRKSAFVDKQRIASEFTQAATDDERRSLLRSKLSSASSDQWYHILSCFPKDKGHRSANFTKEIGKGISKVADRDGIT